MESGKRLKKPYLSWFPRKIPRLFCQRPNVLRVLWSFTMFYCVDFCNTFFAAVAVQMVQQIELLKTRLSNAVWCYLKEYKMQVCMVLPPLFRFSLTWLSIGSDPWTHRTPGTVWWRLELWPTLSAPLWPKRISKKCLTQPYWPVCRTTAPRSSRGENKNGEKSKGRHRTRWRVCQSHGGKGTVVWPSAADLWSLRLWSSTDLMLVWIQPGLGSARTRLPSGFLCNGAWCWAGSQLECGWEPK